MAVLKTMVVQVDAGAGGKKKYYFKSNPLLYASIGGETGVTLAPTPQSGEVIVLHRVEDLLLYRVLVRKAVTTGSTATNRKTTRLLCAVEKEISAETALLQKTIPQGTIRSVSADLRAQYYL